MIKFHYSFIANFEDVNGENNNCSLFEFQVKNLVLIFCFLILLIIFKIIKNFQLEPQTHFFKFFIRNSSNLFKGQNHCSSIRRVNGRTKKQNTLHH